MATGLFITLSEAQLIQLRDNAIANLTAGTMLVSWSDSGTSVSKQITMNVERVLDEVNYALRSRWPDTYGARRRHAASDLSDLDPP